MSTPNLADPTPVGIVSILPTPLESFTVYTKGAQTDQLFFNYPTPGSLFSGGGTTISATKDAATATVALFWNFTSSQLDWWIPTPSVEPPAPNDRTSVKLSASLLLTSSSTSNSATTAESVPASNTTSAPNEPSASTIIPKPTNTSSPGNHRISGGAVAGVAIGCLLGGALIAGVLAWLCWGRQRARHSRYSESSAMALMPPEKGALAHTKSLRSRSVPHVGAGITLPQPLEDQAISGEISKIGNLIKNHVQSYYHSRPVNPGLIDLDDITSLGSQLPISARILSTLLDKPETREVALRFCIAWVTISRLQNYGSSTDSLLPPEICMPMREIAAASHGSKAHALQAARWRVVTADLLQATYARDAFAPSDPRTSAIRSILQTLENILRPYLDSRMNDEERKRNLEEIMKRSALFSFTLFSQPSSWDFDWMEEQAVESGELCIFPALVQVTNEAGDPVTPPRSFSEAVVRKLES